MNKPHHLTVHLLCSKGSSVSYMHVRAGEQAPSWAGLPASGAPYPVGNEPSRPPVQTQRMSAFHPRRQVYMLVVIRSFKCVSDPACYRSRALQARTFPGVSPIVSLKTWGVQGVSHGVSPGPFGPWPSECPESVPSVPDTSGTLSRDAFWTLPPKRPRDICRTLLRTAPVFGDTPGHFRPEGPEGLL